jgi:hypothetical protein
MVESAEARTLDEFLSEVADHKSKVFRGQSTDYPTITPSLFRLREPLDLKPLLKAADSLYMTAHKVVEELLRIREQDDYYSRPLGSSEELDEDAPTGLLGRLNAWFSKKLFPALHRRDDDDDDDGRNWMKLPMGSGMGTAESYSALSGEIWSRSPSEGSKMALLQHYGAPSGTLDVSFDRYVALWFACHIYMRKDGYASYRRNDKPGVVYVLDVPDALVIDLRGGETFTFDAGPSTIPIGGLRGWRQHGGLVFASRDEPDLTKYLVKKISVAPGLFDQNDDRLKLFTQQRLFPGPEEDGFYRTLLDAGNAPDEPTRKLVSYIPTYLTEESFLAQRR